MQKEPQNERSDMVLTRKIKVKLNTIKFVVFRKQQ